MNRFIKITDVQGQQLDFKTWLEPHLNPRFEGFSGKVRHCHTMHFENDEDGVTRLKYKFGDHIRAHLPVGVDRDLCKGLEVMKSYPAFDSSPVLQEVQPVKPKEERETRSAFSRLCDYIDFRVARESQDKLLSYFPLPQTAADYAAWTGPTPTPQAPLDLKVLHDNA